MREKSPSATGRAAIFFGALLAFAALASMAGMRGNARAGAGNAAPALSVGARLKATPLDATQVELTGVEIGRADRVDLVLAPLPIVTANTVFVTGHDERPFVWDASRVRAFRGWVRGNPSQPAFVVTTPGKTLGYVQVDGKRHWINEGVASRVAREAPASPPPNVPLCGADHVATPCCDHDHPHKAGEHPRLAGGEKPRFAPMGAGQTVPASTRVIKLAIETDYEFFALIGDVQEAADYVVALYAADSDIFLSETNARLELTFVRIWDNPADLFNQPDPLSAFVQHWNQEMGAVDRNVAQLLSGRRDLPWGGIAYLSALCTGNAYSVVGYALGFMPDLSAPSIYNFDVAVTAHELGHNFGASHTHSYGLDNCNLLDNTPQRGTLMGYCSQTVSGANAVTDSRFGTFVSDKIRAYLAGNASCGYSDCNGNGIEDAEEISVGAVADANEDGVPDSCQDCNGNGTIDAIEIGLGASQDVDGNGVPDECEPDCNGNGLPDAWDIETGASIDLHMDGIPDECEEDCDGNGQSDYSQIMADLSLDVNRNRRLDNCEDCDGNGSPDLVQLDGAWDAWVGSLWSDGRVRRFNALTGVLAGTSGPLAAQGAKDVRITADGRILVASSEDDRIVELDRTGAVVGNFAAGGVGGLDDPSAIELGPDGNVYVSSRGSNAVLRFDGATGGFLGAFVAPGSGGLVQPFGLAFGPDGNLYVNGSDNRVRKYNGATGASMGVFVGAAGNGGLSDARGMLFLPGGDLLVASSGSNAILRYAGASGAFVGKWNRGGTTSALTFDQPWCIRYGPNGNVYAGRHLVQVSSGEAGGLLHDDIAELHVNSSRIYEFDVGSGNFLRSYVTGHDTGLWLPTGFDFMPGSSVDRNRNNLLDACEGTLADLNGDGAVNGADLGILLASWGPGKVPADLNGDGTVNGADLGLLLAEWTG